MDHDEQRQQDIQESLEQRFRALEDRLAAQDAIIQRQNDALRRREEGPSQSVERPRLPDVVAGMVPPHAQIPSKLELPARKAIIEAYPQFRGMPQCNRDENKLASILITDTKSKEYILQAIPKCQERDLDIMRVAAAACAAIATKSLNSEDLQEYMEQALWDVLALTVDNVQRLAKTQLSKALQAADADGAYALLALDSELPKIKLDSHDLFQTAHVDAIKEFKSYESTLKRQVKDDYKARKRGSRGGFRGGYRGSRGRGGSFRSNYNPYSFHDHGHSNGYFNGYNSGRGRGGGRGRGRGGRTQGDGSNRSEEAKND